MSTQCCWIAGKTKPHGQRQPSVIHLGGFRTGSVGAGVPDLRTPQLGRIPRDLGCRPVHHLTASDGNASRPGRMLMLKEAQSEPFETQSEGTARAGRPGGPDCRTSGEAGGLARQWRQSLSDPLRAHRHARRTARPARQPGARDRDGRGGSGGGPASCPSGVMVGFGSRPWRTPAGRSSSCSRLTA